MEIVSDKPVVMSFTDHDPSGGAGIQADVETLFSMGCHCSSIATAITAQDTWEHKDSFLTSPAVLIEQARAILEDMHVAAFKIGQVGCMENIQAIYSIIMDYPTPPLVLDPSLSNRYVLGNDEIIAGMRAMLLPIAEVTTANLHELRILATSGDTIDACAQELVESGCKYLLVSDVSPRSSIVTNVLYDETGEIQRRDWPRLPHSYIGSGSTLAACVAAHLAHGFDVPTAIEKAQHYTWHSLEKGRRIGMGQHIPNRLFWHDS